MKKYVRRVEASNRKLNDSRPRLSEQRPRSDPATRDRTRRPRGRPDQSVVTEREQERMCGRRMIPFSLFSRLLCLLFLLLLSLLLLVFQYLQLFESFLSIILFKIKFKQFFHLSVIFLQSFFTSQKNDDVVGWQICPRDETVILYSGSGQQ